MIIYQDTEKELFFHDYRKLPSLSHMPLTDLYELKNNLEQATENAWLYGNDLLEVALNFDIRKVNTYIKMYELKAKKQAKKEGVNQ